MPLSLRDNLHWCVCGGRVIFLDLEADRYFGLPGPAEAAFLRRAGGQGRAGDAEPLRPMIARGMLLDAGGASLHQPPPIALPTADLPRPESAAPSIGDVFRLLTAEAHAAWLVRRRGLLAATRLAALPPRQLRSRATDREGRLRRILAAFTADALVVPARDRCLVRAIALHAVCRRQGLAPRLVFGVRVAPFCAHSWVELDDLVLTGDFEQVRLFTPILAVP